MKISILILAMFLISGCVSTAKHSSQGGHNMSNHKSVDAHWNAPENKAMIKSPIKRSFASKERGSNLYKKNCASCHGVNADGKSNIASNFNPRPSDLRKMAGGHLDGDFAWKIQEGRGLMPSWKNKLSQNEIWDIVNYIQSLKQVSKLDHSKPHAH